MRLSRIGWPFIAAAVVSLAGCGDGGVGEVKQWMEEVKRDTRVVPPKLSEPKRFIPYNYAAKNSVDPFNQIKLTIALAKQQGSGNSKFKPDDTRPREPLESFPLDQLRMVGTLEKPGITFALIQVDRSVFPVKMGNHLGQNFGMITKITDTEVELKELVQDSAGDWIERKTKLELQESKK